MSKLVPRTLFSRISLVCLLLNSTFAAMVVLIVVQLWTGAHDRRLQIDRWHLAENLARVFQEILAGDSYSGNSYSGNSYSGAFLRMQESAYRLQQYMPDIDIYLLSADGELLAEFNRHQDVALRGKVRLKPIEKFLGDRERDGLPHLVSDPAEPGRQVIFSAAPLKMRDGSGYLLITLDNRRSRIFKQLLLEDSFMSILLLTAVLGLVGLLLIGRWALRGLARRFSEIRRAVEQYEHGDLSGEISDLTPDELGDVARGVNRMTAAIRSHIDELNQKDRLRRELIMDIWHDVRAPVAAMRGNLELLIERGGEYSPEKRSWSYQALERSVKLLATIIDELQELARLEAKEKRPTLKRTDLVLLAEEVLSPLRTRAGEAEIELIRDFSATDLVVWADQTMLARALLNILDNALRHTPAGGAIELSMAKSDGVVRIAVTNGGSSIPPEALERLFERSYQVKNGGVAVGSAGLGLAIVKRILEAHGADIRVVSDEALGTTFSFELASA